MRLKEIGIKNFRGYRNETRIPIDANVTGITGKNDVGKSIILEVLDIFFERGEVAIDKDDFNVAEPEGLVEIRCVFDNLPAEILLDEANKTRAMRRKTSRQQRRKGKARFLSSSGPR